MGRRTVVLRLHRDACVTRVCVRVQAEGRIAIAVVRQAEHRRRSRERLGRQAQREEDDEEKAAPCRHSAGV